MVVVDPSTASRGTAGSLAPVDTVARSPTTAASGEGGGLGSGWLLPPGAKGRAAGCAFLRPRTPAPSPSILLPWRRPSLPSFLLPQRAEVTPTHSYLTFPDPLASATGGKGRAAGRVPGALQPPTPRLPSFPSSLLPQTRCSPSLLSYLCNRQRGAARTLHPLPASRAATHEPPRGTPTLHGPGPAGIPHPRTAMAMDQIHSCVTPTSGRCSSTTKTSSISPPQAQLTSRSWIREWHQGPPTILSQASLKLSNGRASYVVSCYGAGVNVPPEADLSSTRRSSPTT
ncbi:translation initiation factor IF-2 [Triticum aestivum]|uniref:translation initiation factor IF-2 n=1 Tax=Triticum aestivum TaxID=4565 RepID=UPI001D019788|nr:translation initiation factor IF-2-like [Triticum aestivum]